MQNEIGADNNSIGKAIKEKIDTVTEKNTRFKTMKNISSVLEGKVISRDNKISEELIADDVVHMKFASTT